MKITALLIPIVALAAGCAGGYVGYDTGTTGAYIEDDGPPVGVDVETYPRAYYDGGYVYNVNGRYYRRHGDHGWYRYREAPHGVHFERGHYEHHDHDFDRDRDHDHDHDHH